MGLDGETLIQELLEEVLANLRTNGRQMQSNDLLGKENVPVDT